MGLVANATSYESIEDDEGAKEAEKEGAVFILFYFIS